MPNTPHAQRLERLPMRYALAIAATYLLVGIAYIRGSDTLLEAISGSVQEVTRLQMVKGTAFFVVSALVLFAGAHHLLGRVSAQGLALLRQQEHLRLLDRRALAGTLAAAIAHDGNNELMIAKLCVEPLRTRVPDEGKTALADLEDSIDRLTDMMRRLRDMGSQARASTPKRVDLAEEIRKSLERLRADRRVRGCTIQVVADQPVELVAHPILLSELVTNLVLNAADATDGCGTIEVRLDAAGDAPTLEVSDDGPGLSAEAHAHLFEPFFTTKRDGTGLGLLSVKRCAEDHGGRVEVCASRLGGACFRVSLRGVPERPEPQQIAN